MISSAKRASRLLIAPGRFDQRGKRAAHSSENKAAGSTIWSWSGHAFLQSRATISRVAQRVGANPCHHGDRVGAVVMIGVLELERIAVSSCSSNHAGRRALGDLGCDGRTLQVSELTGRRSVEKDAILRAVPVESYSTSQRVGIVGTGWFSLGPVSTIVNSIMMREKTCLDSRSPSSLQNRLFREFTDTNAPGDFDLPVWIRIKRTTPGTPWSCSNPARASDVPDLPSAIPLVSPSFASRSGLSA
jgi:hypothetical protein